MIEMITISLVKILRYTKVFFLVVRTFKIYSLSNFQIYNTILLTTVTTGIIFFNHQWQSMVENLVFERIMLPSHGKI